MIHDELSVLVVDDTRFSSAYLVRELQNAGYKDVEQCSNGEDALARIEERSFSILIADWMMPEMSGLQLCQEVRKRDELSGHYTYVILVTGNDTPDALMEAFLSGVDDFIDKNRLKAELLARTYGAGRVAGLHNRLLHDNALLAGNREKSSGHGAVDLQTGVGNALFGRWQLQNALEQCAGRGGQVWYISVQIANMRAIIGTYNQSVYDEIARDVCARFQALLRPMDTVVQMTDDVFAAIILCENDSRDMSMTMKRLHDKLYRKEIKTEAGFLDAIIGSSLIAIEQKYAQTEADRIIRETRNVLSRSVKNGVFEIEHWAVLDDGSTDLWLQDGDADTLE